jgi:threonine dehydrogenase-like Zn-dependent dehydrogenase
LLIHGFRPFAVLIRVNFPHAFSRYLEAITFSARREDIAMFMDVVVIAGIGTVGLMVAFLAGFGYFIWKDAHKVKAPAAVKHD